MFAIEILQSMYSLIYSDAHWSLTEEEGVRFDSEENEPITGAIWEDDGESLWSDSAEYVHSKGTDCHYGKSRAHDTSIKVLRNVRIW